MIRIIYMLLIALCVSCNEEIKPADHITALKNTNSWSSEATAVYEPAFGDSLISIIGKVFNNQGFIREIITFSKVPPKKGIYNVFIGGAPYTYDGVGISYSLFEGDGHIISENHILDTLYQNTFEVEEFDESTHAIKATFECQMIYIDGTNDTTYTVFKSGRIQVDIEE